MRLFGGLCLALLATACAQSSKDLPPAAPRERASPTPAPTKAAAAASETASDQAEATTPEGSLNAAERRKCQEAYYRHTAPQNGWHNSFKENEMSFGRSEVEGGYIAKAHCASLRYQHKVSSQVDIEIYDQKDDGQGLVLEFYGKLQLSEKIVVKETFDASTALKVILICPGSDPKDIEYADTLGGSVTYKKIPSKKGEPLDVTFDVTGECAGKAVIAKGNVRLAAEF